MKYPAFFDTTQTITLYDPLSEVLGAFEDGAITFSYLDVVKSAGHSCPTMAGAYLMIREGLKALFPNELPMRGSIDISFKENQSDGTTGVIANAFSLITGATDTWGFKGLGGNYVRKNLMHFKADIPLQVRIKRLDTNAFVDVAYDPQMIIIEPAMQPLMKKLLTGILNEEEKASFSQMWQKRVAQILENFDKVIVIK